MNLSIVDDKLQIGFTFKEQLLAVPLNKLWEIPLAHIEQVTTAEPQSNWRELRAPGSYSQSETGNEVIYHRFV